MFKTKRKATKLFPYVRLGAQNSLEMVFILFFNWRKRALQCCVGFCCTIAQISHNYIYTPSPLSLPPLPHPAPLGHGREPNGAPCAMEQLPTSSLFHTIYIYVHICKSGLNEPTFFPFCDHKSVFYIASSFLPCKQVYQYHFSRFHRYALIYDICFVLLTSSTPYDRLWVHPPHYN